MMLTMDIDQWLAKEEQKMNDPTLGVGKAAADYYSDKIDKETALDPRTTAHDTCRVCGSTDLVFLFSLGEQYVSDFPDRATRHDDPTCGVKCPIDLMLCEGCSLVQLRHTAPQELLYTRHYWYRSGTTQTMRDALRDVTAAAERMVGLQPNDVVLDIGSNDGTLLRSYSKPCFKVGVEPAENLLDEGGKGLNHLIADFWGTGKSLESFEDAVGIRQAKVVTACGMLYDLEDPNDFVEGVARALAPDGVFIAQLMCLKNMLDTCDVGNLAHEHLEYYSLRSLQFLLSKHGLEIFDTEENSVNGRSYRLFVRHQGVHPKQSAEARQRVTRFWAAEDALRNLEFFQAWFAKLEANKGKVRSFVQLAKSAGKRVWVYGASTKGNVILQYYGLDHTLIDAAADKSPEKWGKYTVGTNIPILSEDAFRKSCPEYALVLPYAFLPEFVEREKEWLQGGGKFIVPLPAPMLVGAGKEFVLREPL